MRRASGGLARPLAVDWAGAREWGTRPTRNRGGSTSAVKASRVPSGDQASSPTAPCAPGADRADAAAGRRGPRGWRRRVRSRRPDAADEGDGRAVRREPRPAVEDGPRGQAGAPAPRRLSREGHGTEVGDVPVAPDGPSADDGDAAVGREVVLLEDDLAADVRGGEGAASHRRQGSGAGSAGSPAASPRGTPRVATLRPRCSPIASASSLPRSRRPSPTGRPVVALESTLISHGLPYPANLEVATRVRGGRPRARRDPGDRRDPRRPAPRRPGRGRPRGARHGAGRVGPQGGPTEPRRRARRGWLGRDDGLGHDDRRARRRDPGLRDRRDRRRPPRRAGRARVRRPRRPSTSRRTSRSWGGRRWSSSVPGPKAILDVPATLEYLETRGRAGRGRRAGRAPGLLRPVVRDRGSGVGRRHRRRRPIWPAAHLGLGLGSAVLVCVPVPADVALPDDVARDAVERAVREADAAGVARSGADAVAAGPDRGPHRGRLAPGEHGPHRQRRPGRRGARRPPRRGLTGPGRRGSQAPRVRLISSAFDAASRGEARWYPSGLPRPPPGTACPPRPGPSPPDRRPSRCAACAASTTSSPTPGRRPRRRRPRGRARRVLRAARAQRRRQDDAHQDPDDAAAAVRGDGPDLRLRRRRRTSSASAGS